jgi:hypothetical protein
MLSTWTPTVVPNNDAVYIHRSCGPFPEATIHPLQCLHGTYFLRHLKCISLITFQVLIMGIGSLSEGYAAAVIGPTLGKRGYILRSKDR